MKKVVDRKTSVSLGDRVAVIDEIKKREDRSRSAVIRRAIDYYYLMNYVPDVSPTKTEIKAIKEGMAEFRAGKAITLAELKNQYDMDAPNRTKGQKGSRKTR